MRKSICLLGVMATLMICNHCMAVRVRQEAFNNINCVRPGTRTQRDSPKKDGTRAIEV